MSHFLHPQDPLEFGRCLRCGGAVSREDVRGGGCLECDTQPVLICAVRGSLYGGRAMCGHVGTPPDCKCWSVDPCGHQTVPTDLQAPAVPQRDNEETRK